MYNKYSIGFETIGDKFLPEGYGEFLKEIYEGYRYWMNQSLRSEEPREVVPEAIDEQMRAIDEVCPREERGVIAYLLAELIFANEGKPEIGEIYPNEYRQVIYRSPSLLEGGMGDVAAYVGKAVIDIDQKLDELLPGRNGRLPVRSMLAESTEFDYNSPYAHLSDLEVLFSLSTGGPAAPEIEVHLTKSGCLTEGRGKAWACAGITLEAESAFMPQDKVMSFARFMADIVDRRYSAYMTKYSSSTTTPPWQNENLESE